AGRPRALTAGARGGARRRMVAVTTTRIHPTTRRGRDAATGTLTRRGYRWAVDGIRQVAHQQRAARGPDEECPERERTRWDLEPALRVDEATTSHPWPESKCWARKDD